MVIGSPSWVEKVSGKATGAAAVLVIVKVTVALSVRSLPSVTVYSKLSVVLSPAGRSSNAPVGS